VWRRWPSGWRWRHIWGWCTRSFSPPACLWMDWCDILARKAAIHLILTNHSQVSFSCSLPLYMPSKLNFLLRLFSDLGPRILCCAIVGRKAAIHLILTNCSRVSFTCTLPFSVLRKLNFLLLLFSDCGPRILDQVVRCVYSHAHAPSVGHFGHIQSNDHVRLFELYPTSLPCHSSRNVKTLQDNNYRS